MHYDENARCASIGQDVRGNAPVVQIPQSGSAEKKETSPERNAKGCVMAPRMGRMCGKGRNKRKETHNVSHLRSHVKSGWELVLSHVRVYGVMRFQRLGEMTADPYLVWGVRPLGLDRNNNFR